MNKTIHYCWFGHNKKSRKILKCISSWEKFFPDWEIKEWNEDNFDINCCNYVKTAYELKKWAFVSDYCRFFVLHAYGGLYFDVDVEVIKPFPSNIFDSPFLGLETGKEVSIAPGLAFFTHAGDRFCCNMLRQYEKEAFVKDGFTFKTICQRSVEYFASKGFKTIDKFQSIDGYNIYPSEYFCPLNNYTRKTHFTNNTLAIHLYLGSWLSKKERLSISLNRFLRKIGLK